MNALLKRVGGALLLIGLSTVTFSCSIEGKPDELLGPPTVTLTPVPKTNGVVTPTISATPPPSLTLTATPTIVPTQPPAPPSRTPEPSLTPTPVATLDATEEGALLAQFMRQDESCQLPCWWQIDLGNSMEDVDRHFRSLGLPHWTIGRSILEDRNRMGSVRVGYSDPLDPSFLFVDVNVRFHTLQDRIAYTYVSVERPLAAYGLAEFERDWERFFLDSIIEAYGPPAFLYLVPTSETHGGAIDQSLLLYYPERGITVSYVFHVFETAEGALELCLDPANIYYLGLSLFTSNAAENWAPYLLPPDPESYEKYSWEQRTGQDLSTLYQYLQEGQRTCVILR